MVLRAYILLMIFNVAPCVRASDIFYSVDSADPFSPVTKTKEKVPGVTYIRDPNSGAPDPSSAKIKSPMMRKTQFTYEKKSHGFPVAKIKGSLRQPRIKFSQEKIQLSKLPDYLPKEFLEKPFAENIPQY